MDQPAAQGLLPRLGAELTLDGDLSEWDDAASMPMRFASYIAHLDADRQWRGPTDAGAELLAAWTDEGLGLAAIVTDDDVYNAREPSSYWQQDSLELYIDGRVGPRFMRPPYSAGAYQIFIRPPFADLPPDVAVRRRDGTIDELRVAGQRTAHGYMLELMIPWSTFPNFTPEAGAKLSLQIGLNDYDRRDGDVDQPLQMTWQAATGLWHSPQKFIKWILVESVPEAVDTPLGTAAALDAPAQLRTAREAVVPVTIDIGTTLASQVAAVEIDVRDWKGQVVAELPVALEHAEGAWGGAKTGTVIWDATSLEDGIYTFEARLTGDEGQPLGVSARRILRATRLMTNAKETVAQAIDTLGTLDLVAMAETTPFRVGDVMGAAATVERIKRGITIDSAPTVIGGLAELEARLALLSDESVPEEVGPLAQLLTLTGAPHAQVVIQYPWRDADAWQNTATIAFHLGPVPLATVSVLVSDEAPDVEVADAEEGVTVSVVQGDLVFSCRAPNEEIANLALAYATASVAVTAEQIETLRRAVVEALPEAGPDAVGALSDELTVFGGDLHMHTFYSDGMPSPLGLAFESFYAGMDFAVITDHNTLQGAQDVQALMNRYGFAHEVIVGEEVTTQHEHFNAFPLTKVIDWTKEEEEIVAAAHGQHAAIYWCHPGWTPSHPWTQHHLEAGLEGSGLDAWEHRPEHYRRWKAEGRLPTVVGATDTHNGTFEHPERTLMMAAGHTGAEVAEALQAGRAIMWSALDPDLLVGSDRMIAAVSAALSDADAMRSRSKERIRWAVAKLDLAGLLAAGPSAPPANDD